MISTVSIPEWSSSSTSCGWIFSPARYSFFCVSPSLRYTAFENALPISAFLVSAESSTVTEVVR